VDARGIVNRHCVVATEGESLDAIRRRFTDAVRFIPLLDVRRRLIGVVRRRGPMEGLRIGDRLINDDSPVFVSGEIGIDRNGSEETARRLIRAAKAAGASAARMKSRPPSLCYGAVAARMRCCTAIRRIRRPSRTSTSPICRD